MSDDLIALAVDKKALKATITCSTILIFKCYLSNQYMGYKRFKSGNRPAEDKKLAPQFGDQKLTSKVATDSDNPN